VVHSIKDGGKVEKADILPPSAANSKSFNTFVAAVSVLWNFRYADCIFGINPLPSKKTWIRT